MKRGDMVRFTADELGTLRTEDGQRFTEHKVHKGEFGWYVRAMPELQGETDWHMTVVERNNEMLYVPVHRDMFEMLDWGDRS